MPFHFSSDHNSKLTFTQILVASSIGFIIAAAVRYHFRKLRDQKIIPRLRSRDKGHGRNDKLERFPHYVGKLCDPMPFPHPFTYSKPIVALTFSLSSYFS